MIMVIFGAGASYDSVPSKPPSEYPRQKLLDRPPLANELFLDDGVFQKALTRYPQCHPIVPYLQNPVARASIEGALETLQRDSETDIDRKRQLAAVRFYLRDVIWECEQAWSRVAAGVTNYLTLLDQIRRCIQPGEIVSLVTFNYDQMIETALQTMFGLKFDSLARYISHPTFRLFKLHGSVQWARIVDYPRYSPDFIREGALAQELINRVDTLSLSKEFRLVSKPLAIADQGLALFPAIALPVQSKLAFECPDNHIEVLKKLLPDVTKIIIIGWKGGETHFLALLKQFLRGFLPVCVASGDRRGSEEVLAHLSRSGLSVAAKPMNGGFTEFVFQREAEAFLQSE